MTQDFKDVKQMTLIGKYANPNTTGKNNIFVKFEFFNKNFVLTCGNDNPYSLQDGHVLTRQKIKKIFNKNPEDLYISKDEFNRLMEIWEKFDKLSTISKYNNLYLKGRRIAPLNHVDETFVRSLKVQPEHRHRQVKADIAGLKGKDTRIRNENADLENQLESLKHTIKRNDDSKERVVGLLGKLENELEEIEEFEFDLETKLLKM